MIRWQRVMSSMVLLLYFGLIISVYHNSNHEYVHKSDEGSVEISIDASQTNYDNVMKAQLIKKEYDVLGYKMKYKINAESICDIDSSDGVGKMFLLILVHSAVDNRPQRDAIRNTWGKTIHDFPDVHIVLVFLVGSNPDENKMNRIWTEGSHYQDMIVLDIVDSYRNLSLKSVCGLHWVNHFCSKASFVLKVDDDIYLHLINFMAILPLGSYHNGASQNDSHGLVGALNRGSRVMRHGLWGLGYEEHPAEFYPDYCSGNMYLMNETVVHDLLVASHLAASHELHSRSLLSQREKLKTKESKLWTKIQLVPFEDVFVTGYLRQEIGLSCFNHHGFPHWVVGASKSNIRKMANGELLALHNVYYENMYNVDNILTKWDKFNMLWSVKDSKSNKKIT